jgi:hypothetical protein
MPATGEFSHVCHHSSEEIMLSRWSFMRKIAALDSKARQISARPLLWSKE